MFSFRNTFAQVFGRLYNLTVFRKTVFIEDGDPMSDIVVVGGKEVTHAQRMCGSMYRDEVKRYHDAQERYKKRVEEYPQLLKRFSRAKDRCRKSGQILIQKMPVMPTEPVLPEPEFICHSLRLSLTDTSEGERWVSECGRFIVNYCSHYIVNHHNCKELVFDVRVRTDPTPATKKDPIFVYIVGSEHSSKVETRGVPAFWTPASKISVDGSKAGVKVLVGSTM